MIGVLISGNEADANYWTGIFAVTIGMGVAGAFVGGLCASHVSGRVVARAQKRSFAAMLAADLGYVTAFTLFSSH